MHGCSAACLSGHYHMCAGLMKDRKGHQILWNWSDSLIHGSFLTYLSCLYMFIYVNGFPDEFQNILSLLLSLLLLSGLFVGTAHHV